MRGPWPGSEPGSWLEGAPFLKLPRWDKDSSLSPLPLGQARPIPIEYMMSIQALHLTGGARRLSGVHRSPCPAGR